MRSPKVLLSVFAALLAPCSAFAEIRFGSTLTLSGSTASYGDNSRDGMELAREEINAAGGIRGEPLRILYEDFGEVDLKKAASAGQKLVSVDKVSALLPMITEDAEAVYPIASKRGVVTMAIYAGGKDLTKGKPLFYQVSSADEALVKRISDHALSRGVKRACILAEQGAYALPLAEFGAGYWKGKTGAPAALTDYTPATTDFRSSLGAMQSTGCEALLLLTPPNRQAIVLRQAAELRWNPLKLGLDVSEDPEVLKAAGAASEGLVYAKYLAATPAFASKFHARYGRVPAVPAALAYDAVSTLAAVMNKSGTSGKEAARELDSFSNLEGASGALSFSDGTRSERPVTLWAIQDGKPEPAGG